MTPAVRAALSVGFALSILFGGAAASAATADFRGFKETVVPTRWCGGYFIVDVTIGDDGPFAMILDTGASRTVISPEVRKRLGLARRKKKLPQMTVGPLRASRVPVMVRPLDQISYAVGTGVDGIVGHPIFASFTIVYDYPAREVRVHRDGIPADAPETATVKGRSRPYVPVTVGDTTVDVLLDTGSRSAISLGDFETWDFEDEPVAVGGSIRIDGLHLRHGARLADDARFGPVHLPTPIVTSSVSVHLIGLGIMDRYAVSFDGPGKRVRFDLPQTDDAHPAIELPSLRSFGALFEPYPNALEILKFLPGSPAEAAGLSVGDRIVAIDGRPLDETRCDPDPDAGTREHVTLTVERSGAAPFEVRVEYAVFVE
ncbi:MAG: aspartyl protease family protein [Planctomycetota bacterium]|nr:aspartyl protease family protein [Planctomycetota bacterium]